MTPDPSAGHPWPQTPVQGERLRCAAVCLLLAAAVWIVYGQTLAHGFLNLDDDIYVTANPAVQKGLTPSTVRWAFGLNGPSYWHPLTWLSLMLDHEIFSLDPAGFHAVNLALHALNAMLLFFVFRRMTGRLWPSAFVAALFAVHPMHVESVAWVTERKDTLCLLFGLLAVMAYARYAARPTGAAYLPVVLLLALGLMAKPVLVTLPGLLLLLDFWPLGRTRFWSPQPGATPQFSRPGAGRLVLEKLPLLALSLASAALTWLSHPKAAVILFDYPLSLRLANAVVSPIRYAWKMIWPADIAVIHPFPEAIPLWQTAGAILALAAVIFLGLRQSSRRPHLVFGLLWFLVALAPALKLHGLGLWYSMAARFAYLPFVGLYAIVAFEAPALAARLGMRPRVLAAEACLVLAILAANAGLLAGQWSDSITLFRHSLAVTGDNWKARYNLAMALSDAGQLIEAAEHLREAVRLLPEAPEFHEEYGEILAKAGRCELAVAEFQEALRLAPGSTRAMNGMGIALNCLGRYGEAVVFFAKTLRIKANQPEAHINWGNALARRGDPQGAAAQYQQALRLKPDLLPAALGLGLALLDLERPQEAIGAFQIVLRLDPHNAVALAKLNLALSRLKGDDPASQQVPALAPSVLPPH